MKALKEGLKEQREKERKKDLNGTGHNTQLGYKKVVINAKHGGFSVSRKALTYMREKLDCEIAEEEGTVEEEIDDEDVPEYYSSPDQYRETLDDMYLRRIPRDHEHLIEAVKELGDNAAGSHAELKIVEVPRTVDWEVGEYDGKEWVAEEHREWR